MGKMKNFCMDVEEFVDGYFMDEGVLDHDETFETVLEDVFNWFNMYKGMGQMAKAHAEQYMNEQFGFIEQQGHPIYG